MEGEEGAATKTEAGADTYDCNHWGYFQQSSTHPSPNLHPPPLPSPNLHPPPLPLPLPPPFSLPPPPLLPPRPLPIPPRPLRLRAVSLGGRRSSAALMVRVSFRSTAGNWLIVVFFVRL